MSKFCVQYHFTDFIMSSILSVDAVFGRHWHYCERHQSTERRNDSAHIAENLQFNLGYKQYYERRDRNTNQSAITNTCCMYVPFSFRELPSQTNVTSSFPSNVPKTRNGTLPAYRLVPQIQLRVQRNLRSSQNIFKYPQKVALLT